MNLPKTFLSLGEQIYQTLKERIVDNVYMPGAVLQIDRLADELGVSSTPVRETLFRLSGQGLVTIIRNKGAIVSEIDEKRVQDVWQFRTLLETFTAREAVARLDWEKLRSLKEKIARVVATPGDFELYKETDVLLHDMLGDTENSLVKESLNNLHVHSRRIRYFAENSPFREEVVAQVTNEHLRIIRALESLETETVIAAVGEHLSRALERTMKALRETRPENDRERVPANTPLPAAP